MEAIKQHLMELYQSLRQGDLNVVLGRYSDILLAFLVIAIIGIMIIPIPTFLLDIFLSANMAIAIAVLMISLYIPDALALASFPTILLISTLFRLSLEVSATRLILLYADAGEVIHAFGSFVVKGNLVVGLVIFLIITLLQLIVIAKGAERVSEVSARFTLDAMPGKQMSIDADLRAGLLDAEEAKRKRRLLEKESQFHGAMDGAMKFVKGDAIAGIIISAINIVAGLIIGIVMKKYPFAVALNKYTILTIGEGLVAQIPSLIVTTTSAIITTRVASGEEGGTLGRDLGAQLLAQPTAIAIASGMMGGMALIPGMPTIPFLLLSAVTGATAYSLMKTKKAKEKESVKAKMMESKGGSPQKQSAELQLPVTVPVILETSPSLTKYVDIEQRGEKFTNELLPQMRLWLFHDMGIVFPGVRIRGDATHIPENQYAVYIHEVPVSIGTAFADHLFVADNLNEIQMMGLSGPGGPHPITNKQGMWLPEDRIEQVQSLGARAMMPDEYIAVHLSQVVKKHSDDLVGIQEVQNVLDAMEQQGYAALVKNVVPKLLSIQRLTDILRRLMREEISIKNMKAILEALADWAPYENDAVYLTEYVRMNLKRYIAFKFSSGQQTLPVYLLDPAIEQPIQAGIRQSASGSNLSLDPQISQKIMQAFRNSFSQLDLTSVRPIVLAQMEVRYFTKRLISFEYPTVVVLSFQELPADMRIQPIGRIQLTAGALPSQK
ncbi:MAG: type III secretion system export apparatus subunit SctV [Acidobacteria bacterium]|nr:type III secretion system export apparatus subunit SctV [Acidobacteriota bacterium]